MVVDIKSQLMWCEHANGDSRTYSCDSNDAATVMRMIVMIMVMMFGHPIFQNVQICFEFLVPEAVESRPPPHVNRRRVVSKVEKAGRRDKGIRGFG